MSVGDLWRWDLLALVTSASPQAARHFRLASVRSPRPVGTAAGGRAALADAELSRGA